MLPYQLQVVCSVTTTKTKVFVGIFFGFKALLLLFGVIVAYATRNVAANYNEAQAIGLVTYLTVIIGVIALAICFAIDNTVTANTSLPVFSIIIIITTTLVLLFFAKVYVVNIKGRKELWGAKKIIFDADQNPMPSNSPHAWTDSTTKSTETSIQPSIDIEKKQDTLCSHHVQDSTTTNKRSHQGYP